MLTEPAAAQAFWLGTPRVPAITRLECPLSHEHADRACACGRAGFLYEHGIEDDQFPVAKNMQRANAFYALCAAQVPCVSLVLAAAPVV